MDMSPCGPWSHPRRNRQAVAAGVLAQQRQIQRPVGVVDKDVAATIPALRDVMPHARHNHSRHPRHEGSLTDTTELPGAIKVSVPLTRLDGSTACMAIDGATSAEVFREYVRQVLLPTLRPGDIVVLDNLSAHQDRQAIQLIESVGAVVRFLPPYSPDFNPIEKMWSKIKEFLRAAKARTFDTLLAAMAEAMNTITAQDALGWFQSCGYETCQS